MTWKEAKAIYDKSNTWGEFKDRMFSEGVEEKEASDIWTDMTNYLNDTL